LTAARAVKNGLLATVSCLALTGAASAADLRAPMPTKALAPIATAIWAGSYLGINGGAVWHRLAADVVYGSANLANGEPYDSARTPATGGTIGGQIGYNWQSQHFVYGLEADWNWVNARDSKAQTPFFFAHAYTTKLSWLATVRARAGLTVGTTLIYGTGGLAVGHVKNSWAEGTFPFPIVSRAARAGWTAGGGVEHVVNNSNVTVKAEALYVDLGSRTQETLVGDYRARFKNTAVIGRLGVNLKW
jgi:outer membrane immunogenic protein